MGNGGVKPLSDSDCEEIRRNLDAEILDTGRHPEITFVSPAVYALNDRRWQVEDELTGSRRDAGEAVGRPGGLPRMRHIRRTMRPT